MIGSVILAHLVGDYVIQSHWMAYEKTKRWWPAAVHGLVYTLPFLLITTSWAALLVIAGTHIVIDRYRLAKHVVWAKNWMAPVRVARRPLRGPGESRFTVDAYNPPWREAKRNAGSPPGVPAYMSVWLMIIADNTMHLVINVAAVRWL